MLGVKHAQLYINTDVIINRLIDILMRLALEQWVEQCRSMDQLLMKDFGIKELLSGNEGVRYH